MSVGIVGYGSYIPRRRIKLEEIAKVWGADAPSFKRGLQLHEKSVPGKDEDTITMAVEAGRRALVRSGGIDPKTIGAVYVGSESHPYAVKPSGTVVAEALGITPEAHIGDLEFACKAGTESMYLAYSLVKAGEVQYAFGIGADTSQGAPGNALEYSAAAGAAAFILGSDPDRMLAEVVATYSWTTDTPDFWRRAHMHYPRHGSRYTGEPAYFRHVMSSAQGILDKTGLKPQDLAFAVFHQPNGKFPLRVGKRLGFTMEQMEAGWLSPWLGNTYSGASPIGTTAVFDVGRPGDLVLLTSFGSGAGSDSFIFRITQRMSEVQNLAPLTRMQLDNDKIYIDYGTYAKLRGKIRMGE
ncbi:MAG: hydroxymethylglutaryl-CoA synthase [Acidobacteria bacterium]|nr:hydroxymethylglutaryl-CoA synthase [Acidobacteriota bacterium]